MREHPVGFAQVARTTQRFVRHVITIDGYLSAIENELTVDEARVEHGLTTTATNGFEFFQGVSDLKKSSRAGKCDGLKVRANSIRENGDVVQDRNSKEVIDLVDTEELRLVNQKTGDVLARGGLRLGTIRLEHRPNVVVRANDEVDGPLDTKSRHNGGFALRIGARFRDENLLTSLGIVVGGLQQCRALAAVHRAISEIQLRHTTSVPNVALPRMER